MAAIATPGNTMGGPSEQIGPYKELNVKGYVYPAPSASGFRPADGQLWPRGNIRSGSQ